MKTLTYAPDAWKLLNGFFCIYKPSNVHSLNVFKTLAFNMCRDLNAMETRPPRDLVQLKGSVSSGKPFEIELVPNYADHELVVGSRYQIQDIRMNWIYFLGKNTSGVYVVALNDACKKLKTFEQSNFLRTYEVKGQFGLASTTFMPDGKIKVKTTYKHIHQNNLDRVLASIQASHQSLAFQYAGIDLQSQEAYELATKGNVRPAGKSNPLIYNIKCTELNNPYFTLEIQCINETEIFLAELVHQIGVYVRSCAICTRIRQIRFGHFNLDHALLRKHWTLENIISNITLCSSIIKPEDMMPSSPHFQSIKTSELNKLVENMQEEARKDRI